jgi:tRNA(Ile)-lysidine synthase
VLAKYNLITADWLNILNSYTLIYVGFSGGLDSTVLLHALAQQPQLINKLHAVHINHGLSVNALRWEDHCKRICQQLGIICTSMSVSCNPNSNIEASARTARYQAFIKLVNYQQCLLTAHHQDDQAETILLHLMRGSGLNGISGISVTRKFGDGYLHRPLLLITRRSLLEYAELYNLSWIEDESNNNLALSRNFIRQKIIPLLVNKWPKVSKNLARTGKHCAQAQSNLCELAKLDCPALADAAGPLSLADIRYLSAERVNNVLQYWLQKYVMHLPNFNIFQRLITELVNTDGAAAKEVKWGLNRVVRYKDKLYFLIDQNASLYGTMIWFNFPQKLILPDMHVICATSVQQGIMISANQSIEIRFRQGGEKFFWHGQTKSLKKLMAEWQIPPWLRDTVPLLYIDGQLACVVNYAMSDLFYRKNTQQQSEVTLWQISY